MNVQFLQRTHLTSASLALVERETLLFESTRCLVKITVLLHECRTWPIVSDADLHIWRDFGLRMRLVVQFLRWTGLTVIHAYLVAVMGWPRQLGQLGHLGDWALVLLDFLQGNGLVQWQERRPVVRELGI
jgi:hypothetical protein